MKERDLGCSGSGLGLRFKLQKMGALVSIKCSFITVVINPGSQTLSRIVRTAAFEACPLRSPAKSMKSEIASFYSTVICLEAYALMLNPDSSKAPESFTSLIPRILEPQAPQPGKPSIRVKPDTRNNCLRAISVIPS